MSIYGMYALFGLDEEQHQEIPTAALNAVEKDLPKQETKPIAAAYEEDLDNSMAPPTAPSGPSSR